MSGVNPAPHGSVFTYKGAEFFGSARRGLNSGSSRSVCPSRIRPEPWATAPSVSVASSPLTPEVALEVSKVRVRLKVVLGLTYQLESSKDLNAWTAAGASFVAQDELSVQEFDVDSTGRHFRISALP